MNIKDGPNKETQECIRSRPFNFWGRGGWFWKKNILQGHSEQKNTCTNKLREKKSCPIIWWGKNVAKQHGCKDRFDQSQKLDQLVWFSGTSVRLISCWKTPQSAGNSLSELHEIQNFLGGMPPDPSRGSHLWWSTRLSQNPRYGLICCPMAHTY
jgi:hypothetical protein